MSFISQKFKSSVDGAIDDVQSIDKTLTKIFKLEKKEAKEEEVERKKKDTERRRKAREEKRKKADDNILKKITKKKEDKETKKGLLETLKDALGPILGVVKGIGGMLMSAVGGLGLGGILMGALVALKPIIIAALAGIAVWAAWQARHEIGKMLGGRGDTIEEQGQNFADDNRSWASQLLTGVKISDARRLMNQENIEQRQVAVDAQNAYRDSMASGSGATEEEQEALRVKAEEENKRYEEGRDALDRVVRRDNMVGQLDRIQQDLAMEDDEVPWWKHMGDVKKWRQHLERRQRELTQNIEASNNMIRDNAELYEELGIDSDILADQFTAEDGSIDLATGQQFEVRSDSTTGAIIQSGAVTNTEFLNGADGPQVENLSIQNDLDPHPTALQNGGFVVPGHGHGDQFYTRVPQGSFVLNRNAVKAGRAMGMFQQGGAPAMQDVVLEPGEMVFGPGQWENQGIQQLNNTYKRFQAGGVTNVTNEGSTTNITNEGSTTNITNKVAAPMQPTKPNREKGKKGNVFTNMLNGIKSFMGFQEGGETPQQDVVLEPGEMVFPQATPELVSLNSNFKRFQPAGQKLQTGGLVQANHPDTGEGWSVGKDSYGRPSVLSKPAGEAFLRAMKASKGKVKTSDITSSTRSPAKNKAVGGVPNSNHLYGNALDIHGTSKVWLKEHGPKYGWKNLVYSGHDGHFDFKGGGGEQLTPAPGDGKEKTAADATPQTGSSVSTDTSAISVDSILGIMPNASNELGDLLNMEGIGTFASTFISGVGDFLKEELFGEGSKNLAPTSASQKTGSDLVDQSDSAGEGGSETVIVDLGGDKDVKGEVISEGSLNNTPPELPDGPSSSAAADYFFTVNMCV